MACKYAYQAALDDVKAFINHEHEKVTEAKRDIDSSHSGWWRLTGEQDFMLKFYNELGQLMSRKHEL